MLADKYLRDELNKFAKYVIQQARNNLTKGEPPFGSFNDTKNLYNSLGFTNPSTKGVKTSVAFKMADYGKFRDRGVSGKNKKYDTPYNYKDAAPPPNKLDKWIVRKGLAPRKNGKFTGRKVDAVGFRKSIQFLISRKIYSQGIRPSMFFTKPFEAAFKRLPDELVEAYSIGLEKQIQVNISK